MKFQPTSKEQWLEAVQKQLKKDSLENLSLLIDENILMEPIYDSQQIHDQSAFSSKMKWLSNVSFASEFADHTIGTTTDYAQANVRKGIISVLSMEDCREIEENSPENDFTYWLDLFHEFETEEGKLIALEQAYSLYDTFSESIQNKIFFVVDIALHQNCGAGSSLQLAIALAKLNEIISFFSPLVVPKIIFRLAVGEKFLEEIAKLRALRMLVHSFLSYLNLSDSPIEICCMTTQINKTHADTENNLIRSTLEVSAAYLGGATFFECTPFRKEGDADWANEVSLKQGLIISHESLLSYYDDALSGSFIEEKLSKALAEKAWKRFQYIEENGGYLSHFDQLNADIFLELLTYIDHINTKKHAIVGYNIYEKENFKEIKAPKKSNVLKVFILP